MANEEKQEDAAPSVVIPEERPYPKGFRCGYIAVVGRPNAVSYTHLTLPTICSV